MDILRQNLRPEFINRIDVIVGARPLRRTTQRLVENELSRMVLAGTVQRGDRVTVDAIEGELHFDVDTGAASFAEAEAEETETAAPATA